MLEICPICAETIQYAAFGDCNHHMCHLCSIRLRVLYKTTACAICKTEMKAVMITQPQSVLPFSEFKLSNYPVLKKFQLYFENRSIWEEVQLMLRYNCPLKECDYAAQNWHQLKQHTKAEHNLYMCDICIKHKKIFSHQHSLFTKLQLEKHSESGDENDPSFKGHPMCEFCRVNFYSTDELFEHCRLKHENCHICQRKGIHHQYYKDYSSLEDHFRRDHYACLEKECLEKKFVVFDSSLDLKQHQLEEHSQSLSKTQQRQFRKVEVDIQYASARSQKQRRRDERPTSASTSQIQTTETGPQPDIEFPALGNLPAASSSKSKNQHSLLLNIKSNRASKKDLEIPWDQSTPRLESSGFPSLPKSQPFSSASHSNLSQTGLNQNEPTADISDKKKKKKKQLLFSTSLQASSDVKSIEKPLQKPSVKPSEVFEITSEPPASSVTVLNQNGNKNRDKKENKKNEEFPELPKKEKPDENKPKKRVILRVN